MAPFRDSRTASRWFPIVVAVTGAMVGCIDRTVTRIPPVDQSATNPTFQVDGADKVDLLLEVDNSNSMASNQSNIMAQFSHLIDTLTSPMCTSAANTTPHTCDPQDSNDHPQYPAVHDLHVGVISQDLGTPGFGVCSSLQPGTPQNGDDGLLNPIRFGPSLQQHEPWTTNNMAPAGFRPDDCQDANAYPAFIEFHSATTDPATFAHDFRCNAGLYVRGCGLEQQLEAVYRALIQHDPRAVDGNNDPNAGFLRSDALLAIVVLTDEEDGSVRDCHFANGTPCDPTGGDPNPIHNQATSVWDSASTAWAGGTDLNLRFYAYQPGSAQDPTWPLERYVDPHDVRNGFLSLKPGNPQRVLFAAITAVPLDVPTVADHDGVARTDWNALLGTPDHQDPENFYLRDSTTSVHGTTALGEFGMQQAQIDPNYSCGGTHRAIPACRRARGPNDVSIGGCPPGDEPYFAVPARRIVEIARRFDESPLCNGQPCRNGLVASICSDDYSSAMADIVQKIAFRLQAGCLDRPLRVRTDPSDGTHSVDCTATVMLSPGQTCDSANGLVAKLDSNGSPVTVTDAEQMVHVVCVMNQIKIASNGQPEPGQGWYYQNDSTATSCASRLVFMPTPPAGSRLDFQCIQSFNDGTDDAGTVESGTSTLHP